MPRIRQNAQQYLESDFRKALNHCMVDAGLDSKKDVAEMAGIPHTTLCKRIREPDTMTVSEMRRLFLVVRPPADVLLRMLGYSVREIRTDKKGEAHDHEDCNS